jgi:hypothetical protein
MAIFAQESSLEQVLPAFKDRAVVISMVTRVIDDQIEVWHSNSSKVTLPGKPVGLKIVGTNVVIVVQFTPYIKREGTSVLVAQGQVWIDVPDEGIQYQTSIRTIPVEFGEQVYFLPLGDKNDQNNAHIEIQLELLPYLWEPQSDQ